MEEIKVGEYVRTKKDGICKLLQIDEDNMWCGYVDKPFWLRKDNIVKHSSNIIDLIEEGDYVNGHLVLKVEEDKFLLIDDKGYTHLAPINIKSICTKEQFENISYKLEG